MSNYLILVSNGQRRAQVQSWISRHSGEEFDEICTVELAPNMFLTYVAKEARADVDFTRRILFKGFAVDHGNAALSFGVEGATELSGSPWSLIDGKFEGCFVAAHWDRNSLTVAGDLFRMCPVLYFDESDIFAASDSYFMLTALRRELALANERDERNLIARSWLNAMGGQLLGTDTSNAAIKYAHVGVTLEVTFSTDITTRVKISSAPELFYTETENYGMEIVKSARQIASLVHTLASISPGSARFSLSGGFDSRVCLAAATLSDAAMEFAQFSCMNTSPAHARDFEVVSGLSEKFGFPLGVRENFAPRSPVTERIPSALCLWFLSNACVYDYLKLPNYLVRNDGYFTIGGFGAELYKGNYGWRPISAIVANIADERVATSVRIVAEAGVEAMGISAEAETGSEWHYLGFRNAIHSGRFAPTNMLGVRPLMMGSLVGLSRAPFNPFPAPGKSRFSMVNDLLITLNPEMAKFPFDKSIKNMSETLVEERRREIGLGVSSADLEEYRILGNHTTVLNGSPRFFNSIGKNTGMSGAVTRARLEEMVRTGYDTLDTGVLREVYRPVLEEAINKLRDESVPLSQARSAPGKLLSLLV